MSGIAMSTAAPKGRKHLCADSLFNLLHGSFATIADDVNQAIIAADLQRFGHRHGIKVHWSS